MRPVRVTPGPGQESVWDYPRPPRVEPDTRHVRVELGGLVVAESRRAVRVLETSHPPTWYIPRDDVRMELLEATSQGSFCEWKGTARYFDVVTPARRASSAAWTYPRPSAGFEAIADHLAFYASRVDACFVGDERVTPQPGAFYAGWITSDVVGPFKGEPGTHGW